MDDEVYVDEVDNDLQVDYKLQRMVLLPGGAQNTIACADG
jgi:hypothetical protein